MSSNAQLGVQQPVNAPAAVPAAALAVGPREEPRSARRWWIPLVATASAVVAVGAVATALALTLPANAPREPYETTNVTFP